MALIWWLPLARRWHDQRGGPRVGRHGNALGRGAAGSGNAVCTRVEIVSGSGQGVRGVCFAHGFRKNRRGACRRYPVFRSRPALAWMPRWPVGMPIARAAGASCSMSCSPRDVCSSFQPERLRLKLDSKREIKRCPLFVAIANMSQVRAAAQSSLPKPCRMMGNSMCACSLHPGWIRLALNTYRLFNNTFGRNARRGDVSGKKNLYCSSKMRLVSIRWRSGKRPERTHI